MKILIFKKHNFVLGTTTTTPAAATKTPAAIRPTISIPFQKKLKFKRNPFSKLVQHLFKVIFFFKNGSQVDGNGGHSISQEDGHKYWNRACCAYMVNVEQANAKDKGIDPDDDGKNSATGLVSALAIFMPFVAVLFMQ